MCYVDFLDQILVSSSVGKYFMDNRLFYSYELGISLTFAKRLREVGLVLIQTVSFSQDHYI